MIKVLLPWLIMLRSGLTELGVPSARVTALADLILDTIDGLLLDRLVNRDQARCDAAAAAFADLLERVKTHPGPGQEH